MKKIVSELIWDGDKYILEYSDQDTFENLPYKDCRQVYGVCFVGDKMVIAYGESGKKGKAWGLVGGHIEKGETYEQALEREVEEETNMKVVMCRPIGLQKVVSPNSRVIYQLRYVALVKPLGKFEKDPAGSVGKIKMIDPRDYKKYFDWGEIGDRIIKRALKLKSKFKSSKGGQA